MRAEEVTRQYLRAKGMAYMAMCCCTSRSEPIKPRFNNEARQKEVRKANFKVKVR